MFGLGQTEIIVILVIMFLLFGYKKLPLIGENMGKAVKKLKSGVNDDNEDSSIC